MIKDLVKNQAKFFTYTLPLEKTASLIIRGLGHTYTPQDIADKLKAQGISSVLSIKSV